MKTSILFSKKSIRYFFITLIWLAVWEMASLIVDNGILLVGPLDVVKTLYFNIFDPDFYLSAGSSLCRIGAGFFLGLFSGVLFAFLSWKCSFIEELLKPLMAFLKTAPVASFIVLFLIWWSSNILSVAIAVCVVLPQIYISVLMGLKNTDKKIEEMADLFNLHPIDRLHYIYRPAVSGYLESAVRISAAMAWKAGVAAEVIGTPENTLGSSLYMSKIYLDTAGVLSYTAVIILLSVVCERVLLFMYRLYNEHEFKCFGPSDSLHGRTNSSDLSLSVENISKSYDKQLVLDNYSAKIGIDDDVLYDWPSGKGKTTLFRIIARLDKDYSGDVIPNNYRFSMLFQEDRLIEGFSALVNTELVCGDRERAMNMLKRLLPEEVLYKEVNKLSGGQRRRVAIARACLKEAEVVLFDEPYEGLDSHNRSIVKEVIKEYGKDKIVLIASHIKD